MSLDADEFPVIDALPRPSSPPGPVDAPTQQLAPTVQGTDTRPLLSDEYPPHIAAQLYSREMWRSWRVCVMTLVGALVFQIVALFIVEAFLYSLVPHTIPRGPWRPTTAYEWLHIVPYVLLVVGAVAMWRKSRAVAWGLILSILICFCVIPMMPIL